VLMLTAAAVRVCSRVEPLDKNGAVSSSSLVVAAVGPCSLVLLVGPCSLVLLVGARSLVLLVSSCLLVLLVSA